MPPAIPRMRGPRAASRAAAILFFSACRRSPTTTALLGVRKRLPVAAEMLFPLSRSALGLTVRGIQRTVARQAHHEHGPDFHEKYGNMVLLGGAVFCVSVWTFVATQTGIEWNLSPVGRVTPKEWREK
ncbi:hypothetical protein lerEdw1_010316 [Lerista edwardsae]|nr:hypothetical protein lerEdw1_010316 [Lerista edwardsae]